MRKVVLYIAVSLDGYIATKEGDVSWLGGDGSDAENFGSFPTFIETVDTVVLGYQTYHEIVTKLSPDAWPYEGKTSYVLTHKKLDNQEGIYFTDMPLDALVQQCQEKEGKDIWICGGANIIKQFHDQGLIDTYAMTLIPTLLGDGIRLFEAGMLETKLKLVHTQTYNGMVDVVYTKRV